MKFRWLLYLAVALIVALVYFTFLRSNGGEKGRTVVLTIEKGSNVEAVADSLAAHGLVRSKFFFQLAARTLGVARKLRPGQYRLSGGLTNAQLVGRLTGTEYLLMREATFPEGITMYRVASIAHAKLNLDSALFIRWATDTTFLRRLGVPAGAKTAEGYLFPDTYRFMLTVDPQALIRRMVDRWKVVVLDSLYARSNPSRSITDVMTLASIVESEARLSTERDTIAGVYLNRLRIGMKLDADPTVQYGLHLTRPIGHSDLLKSGAYNTYLNAGLPPGPICSPGAKSVWAALHPAKHPYLFFVARGDGSGGHYFSRTFAGQTTHIRESDRNERSR